MTWGLGSGVGVGDAGPLGGDSVAGATVGVGLSATARDDQHEGDGDGRGAP